MAGIFGNESLYEPRLNISHKYTNFQLGYRTRFELYKHRILQCLQDKRRLVGAPTFAHLWENIIKLIDSFRINF